MVKAKRQDQTVAEVVARTKAELYALGDRYRDQWRIRGSIEGNNGGGNDDQDDGGDNVPPRGKGKGKAKDKGKGKAKDNGNTTTPKTPKTSKTSKPPKKGGKGSGPSGSTSGPSGSTAGPSKPSTTPSGSISASSDSTVTAGPSGSTNNGAPTAPTPKKPTSKTAKGKGKAKAVDTEEEFEHELPTLYGLVIANTIVAIVSYNVAVPRKDLRTIAIFDFGDNDQDVWNAFAVAIVVVTVRNFLMGLEWEDKVEVVEEDPDL